MKLINLPFFWILIVALTIAAVFAFFRFRKLKQWGFKELVTNPKLWDDMTEAHQKAGQAAEEAKHWNDAEVASAVKAFLFHVPTSRGAWDLAHVLQELGARTHPAVLETLSDANLHSKLVKSTGKDLGSEAPFNRACDLLGDTPPLEAAPVLASFIADPFEEIRKDAALALRKIGSPEVVGALKKSLADEDEYVRSYGLMGLEFAVNRNRLNERCARELYADIERLLLEGKNSDKSAKLLLHINESRAVDLFLSDRILNPSAPSLHDVLRALADKEIVVPRDRLLGLITQLETLEMKYPYTSAL
jgi:hypothetical protein